MMTVKEAAHLWNLSERRVNELCIKGRLEGAVKSGRRWEIPDNTQRPRDARYKKSLDKYIIPLSDSMVKEVSNLKPIPIGISDFKTVTTAYHYVDKTIMIKELIDSGSYISLFTRPRRFGKTLNMDMLRVFFERSKEDNSVYFTNKNIWKCGPEYTNRQGKYPVIWLSFKDIKDANCSESLIHIRNIIREEYTRHNIEFSDDLIQDSIRTLSRILYLNCKKKVILLIDEYDTPIQTARLNGYYDEIIDAVRMMLSSCLKDNPYLEMGVLTGILEVSKESIFSALNNVQSFSLLTEDFSSCFGFTEDEICELARARGYENKTEEIKEWYNGYKFGNTSIYNPWSVLMYLSKRCLPAPYWRNTGNNQILGEMIDYMDVNLKNKLLSLIQGQSITSIIDTRLAYTDLKKNPYAIFSMLLAAGYLKANETEMENGHMFGHLSLPNKELACVFKEEILNRFTDIIPEEYELSFLDAIKTANAELLEDKLKTFLKETVSYHDAASESFYHGLLLGLCAQLSDYYFLSSNKEAGYGRYDIQLEPKKKNLPGIIIEVKSVKDKAKLEDAAANAVKQICRNEYYAEMKKHGVGKILSYGVAFCGKNSVVKILS